jgi:hypothetical protein
MKYLLSLCIILGAALFGWPLLKENTTDECTAVANRAAGNLHFFLNNPVLGTMGQMTAEKVWPGVPPQIACTLVYWMGAPRVEKALEEERQRQDKAAQAAQRAIQPEPLPAKPAAGQAPTYKPAERREMDRLIQNTR